MSQNVAIRLEFTPNPSTLKFVTDQSLVSRGAINFANSQAAIHSPLAKRLFNIPGVSAVMVGSNFVTITKADDGNWDIVADEVPKAIEGHFKSGEPHFDAKWLEEQNAVKPASGPDLEIENKIREVLDTEIRPAVAMDGGDITFGRYEEGIVYLHLQGACSSCPSSVATLKMGVETRLKEVVPQIKEVVQM